MKRSTCPYCNKRPRKDVTCGKPACQIKRSREKNREWYRKYRKEMGESYRAGWRAHSGR